MASNFQPTDHKGHHQFTFGRDHCTGGWVSIAGQAKIPEEMLCGQLNVPVIFSVNRHVAENLQRYGCLDTGSFTSVDQGSFLL